MKTTAKVDEAGRVLIPKKLRDQLGVQAGMEVEMREFDGRVVLHPVRPKARLVRKKGMLVIDAGAPPKGFDLVKFIKELREERSKSFE